MNLIVVSDIYAYMKKLTTESFILKSKKVHGDKYDYSLVEYKDSHTHIDIICPTHNIFKQKPYCHLNKEGCRKCSDELKFQKRRHNKDIFIERSQKVHDNKYDYSLTMYRNSRTKVDIVCPKHGVFTQSPPHHLNGAGCPICKSSKGEIEVQKFLKNRNINYIQQHTFNDCKNLKVLRFDFYLPEYKICIEYDGRQHFNPIDMFGGDRAFELLRKNDEIKNTYCSENEINLIRVNYKDNIEEILNKII